MPTYLNIRQAADYLGISPHTLYKLVERREVPAAKVGGAWRFREATIDRYLERKSGINQPSLLVVDKDPANRKEISSIAISRGASPVPASDPEEALLLMSGSVSPDLVIYRCEAPGETLAAFVRNVKALQPGCRIAVCCDPAVIAVARNILGDDVEHILAYPLERPEIVNLVAAT